MGEERERKRGREGGYFIRFGTIEPRMREKNKEIKERERRAENNSGIFFGQLGSSANNSFPPFLPPVHAQLVNA